MEKSTTPAGGFPAAIVEEAWQQVGASFERFWLTAGIATLAGMMEGTRLGCAGSVIAAMTARMGIVGGGPRESWASTGAKWRWSDRACGPATAARSRCRVGKRRWQRIGWADGRST